MADGKTKTEPCTSHVTQTPLYTCTQTPSHLRNKCCSLFNRLFLSQRKTTVLGQKAWCVVSFQSIFSILQYINQRHAHRGRWVGIMQTTTVPGNCKVMSISSTLCSSRKLIASYNITNSWEITGNSKQAQEVGLKRKWFSSLAIEGVDIFWSPVAIFFKCIKILNMHCRCFLI